MNKDFENDIKSLLVPKSEREKKQVALFLPPYKIEELDELVKELAKFSNGQVNRNVLLEKAVDNLIKTLPSIIEEYELVEKLEEDIKYDTIVCPSLPSGLDFIEKYDRWEFVKLDSTKIKNVKYLALYVGAPHSQIKVYMEIDRFEDVIMPDKQKKYVIHLKRPYYYMEPGVKLGNSNSIITRGVKYTALEKILGAKEYKDILL